MSILLTVERSRSSVGAEWSQMIQTTHVRPKFLYRSMAINLLHSRYRRQILQCNFLMGDMLWLHARTIGLMVDHTAILLQCRVDWYRLDLT